MLNTSQASDPSGAKPTDMERRFQLKRWRSTGVWPFGAHVAPTEGRRLNPLSSWMQIHALRRRAFSLPGPLLLHPVGDDLVVTLYRTARRALTTPSHLPQDPPHVPRVVTDASQGFDHFRHALQRPHVGRVAVFERPLLQLLLNEAQVRLIELSPPASSPCGTTGPPVCAASPWHQNRDGHRCGPSPSPTGPASA